MKCFSARPPRAQSSLEFAVLAGMFMIMFMAFFYVLSDRMMAFQQQRDQRAAYDLIYKVQNEFNLAFRVHDGYNRTFWLPLEMYGNDYAISLTPTTDVPTELTVDYRTRSYSMPMFVNLTTGSQVVKGKNRIQKARGNITVGPTP